MVASIGVGHRTEGLYRRSHKCAGGPDFFTWKCSLGRDCLTYYVRAALAWREPESVPRPVIPDDAFSSSRDGPHDLITLEKIDLPFYLAVAPLSQPAMRDMIAALNSQEAGIRRRELFV